MNCTTVLSNILNEVKLNGVSVAQEHSLDPEYKYLSAILNVTPIQSVLLACILESSFTRTGTSVKQICNLLKCTNIEFLHYTNELDIMVKRRIIQQNVTMTPFSESSGYVVTPKAIEAIRQDKAFIEEQITNLSSEQLFDRIGKLIMDQGNDGLKIEELKEKIGDKKVLCALSGGVDSSVAASLLSRAVGSNLTCIFVDHGLLRKYESDEVEKVFGNRWHEKSYEPCCP